MTDKELCKEAYVQAEQLRQEGVDGTPNLLMAMLDRIEALAANNERLTHRLKEMSDDAEVQHAVKHQWEDAYYEADHTRAAIARWKESAIYPYETEPAGRVEEVQREVFHLVAHQIDRHLPHFHKAQAPVQKAVFQLIRHSVETNPESLARLIQGYSHIPASERARVERVLERTTLRRLFEGAELIQNRLAVLTGMEELLNNPRLRRQFSERKQLHEIVARNLWILDDNFYLSGSDQTLSRCVQKHVAAMRGTRAVDPDFSVMDGRKRVDVMLTRQNRASKFDHLVVELKRPTEKGGAAIVTQMLEYAVALAEDPQWNNHYVTWTFWGIVYDLDAVGLAKTRQKDRAPGLVDSLKNCTIWLKTWSEVIADARKRLEFLRESLDVQTTVEHGLTHLASDYPDATPAAINSLVKIGTVARPFSPRRHKQQRKVMRGRVRGRRRTAKADEARVRKMVQALVAELKNRMLDRNTPEPTPDVCRWTADDGGGYSTACGSWESHRPDCPTCGKRVVEKGGA